MKSYLQFIFTPSADAQGTLLFLHFDDRRYLIGNLPEGTQRLCSQRGVGLRKVTDVLISGKTEWESVGGLIGAMLSLADVKRSAIEAAISNKATRLETIRQRISNTKNPSQKTLDGWHEQLRRIESEEPDAAERLRLYGAPNLNYAVACARRFVFRTGAPLDAREFGIPQSKCLSGPEPWSDDYIQVWPLPIEPTIEQERSAPEYHMSHSRKRSYAEFRTESNPSTDARKSVAAVAKDIVNDMFNSNWTPDRLVQQPLKHVQMPAVPFVKDENGKLVQYEGPLPGSNEPLPDINVLVRLPWPGALTAALPRTAPSPTALSYIIKNHPQRGKFDKERAKNLNIQPTSLYQELTAGRTVKNIYGEDITPEMVMEPSRDGNGFVFADIPSADYLDDFVARPEWQDSSIMTGIVAFVWSIGQHILGDPRFVSFRDRFPAAKHVLSCPEHGSPGVQLTSSIKASATHNRLAPAHFTLLQDTLPGTSKHSDSTVVDGFEIARPALAVTLEPQVSLLQEVGGILPFKEEEAFEVFKDSELQSEIAKVDQQSSTDEQQKAWTSAVPFQDVEIYTLGTGSSCPSKHRNVSSTLVRVPGQGSYLLDAGEGTLGTLRRIFSPEVLDSIFRDLKLIWISHLHADHHLGTVSVIKEWYRIVHDSQPCSSYATASNFQQESSSRLGVVSDVHMLDFLKDYANIEDFGSSRILPVALGTSGGRLELRLPSDPLGSSDYEPVSEDSTILDLFNLSSLDSVYVRHCRGARAITMTTKSGFKFSYSGDCRPCLPFAVIGKDSHVLIHEATFEDDLRGEALAKKHSTAGEALVIAAKMKARSVVLTHFSQRYPKMSDLGSVNSATTTAPATNGNHEEPQPSAASEAAMEAEDVENADDESALIENLTGPPKPTDTMQGAVTTKHLDADTDPSTLLFNTRSTISSEDVSYMIEQYNLRIVMAFDGMRVRMSDFPDLQRRQPLLRLLYEKLAALEAAKEKAAAEALEAAEKAKKAEKEKNKAAKPSKSERKAMFQTKQKKTQKSTEGESNGQNQTRGIDSVKGEPVIDQDVNGNLESGDGSKDENTEQAQ